MHATKFHAWRNRNKNGNKNKNGNGLWLALVKLANIRQVKVILLGYDASVIAQATFFGSCCRRMVSLNFSNKGLINLDAFFIIADAGTP